MQTTSAGRKRWSFVTALFVLTPSFATADPPADSSKIGDRAAASLPAQDDAAKGVFAYLKNGERVPLFSERSGSIAVAKAGGEVVSLRDLADALGAVHQGHSATATAGERDFHAVLDRLINVRLAILEARAMGIDELPQYKASVDDAKESILRELVKLNAISSVQADPREVERLYKKAAREWKIRSVLFFKDEDAKRMAASLATGASFDELSAQAVAQKKAKGGDEGQFLREGKMLPPVLEAVRKLKVGGISKPIQLPGGVALLRLEGERVADDPQERAKIEAGSRLARRQVAIRKYAAALIEKYAKVDKKLLAKLDLEAPKPGIEALAQDTRVLTRIQGEKPITVAEWVGELRKKFFHGPEGAIQRKKLNAKKQVVLDEMLHRRLLLKEGLSQRLQETEEYKRQVGDYADRLAFGAVFERVILTEVKVTDEEARAYYEKHKGEFTTPTLFKLRALAFGRPEDAEAAFQKLKTGTDFNWMAANADGQLEAAKQSLHFDQVPVIATSLPAELAGALTGAKSGDYRRYADANGGHYVIGVTEEIPPTVQTFDETKASIGKKLQNEKVNKAFEDWTAKLRQHYAVEVLLTKIGS